MATILFKEESYKIIGACMKVHKELGPGFLESVYAEALEIELNKAEIPNNRETKLPVLYEGNPLNKYFRADFVCYNSIILELKATRFLIESDYKQTLNNIKATNFKLGILINFGEPSLKYRRVINSHNS